MKSRNNATATFYCALDQTISSSLASSAFLTKTAFSGYPSGLCDCLQKAFEKKEGILCCQNDRVGEK